jgi:type IV pilus assembly protein PilA
LQNTRLSIVIEKNVSITITLGIYLLFLKTEKNDRYEKWGLIQNVCNEKERERKMNMILKKQVVNLKKGKKRGFTLVEVIVVLVILAILAAIAVPALTGYIDKAKLRAASSEGHAVLIALQTIATEAYAGGVSFAAASTTITATDLGQLAGTGDATGYAADFEGLSERKSADVSEIGFTASGNGYKVGQFKYMTSYGTALYYFDGAFSTTRPDNFRATPSGNNGNNGGGSDGPGEYDGNDADFDVDEEFD